MKQRVLLSVACILLLLQQVHAQQSSLQEQFPGTWWRYEVDSTGRLDTSDIHSYKFHPNSSCEFGWRSMGEWVLIGDSALVTRILLFNGRDYRAYYSITMISADEMEWRKRPDEYDQPGETKIYRVKGVAYYTDSVFRYGQRWEFRLIMNDSAYHAIPDSLKSMETVEPFKVTYYPPAIYEFGMDTIVVYPTAMIDGVWYYTWDTEGDSVRFYEDGVMWSAYRIRPLSSDRAELTGFAYDKKTGRKEERIEFVEKVK